MTRPISPMLACTLKRLDWPTTGLWVQPKFDGLRCIIDPEAGPVTRTGEPIPCPAVREALTDPRLAGLDGELTAPGGLEAAQSAFMGHEAPPDGWRFTAFDDLAAFSRPFEVRLTRLRGREASLPGFALISPARFAAKAGDAAEAFAAVVADHKAQDASRALDGLILRSPAFPYREGRANSRRGELIKLKPCGEQEALILDVEKRADDSAAVGSIRVQLGDRTVWTPAGLSRDQARALWADRDNLPGRRAVVRSWGATRAGSLRHAVSIAVRRDLAA